jgi:hypothetical protein
VDSAWHRKGDGVTTARRRQLSLWTAPGIAKAMA